MDMKKYICLYTLNTTVQLSIVKPLVTPVEHERPPELQYIFQFLTAVTLYSNNTNIVQQKETETNV